MAAITVSELVKEVGIAEEELGVKCSQEHLLSASSFLDWRRAAPLLGLSEREIGDIDVEGKTEQEKRTKTLEMWRGKYGFRATCGKLVDALLAARQANDAEKVCRLLVEGESIQSPMAEAKHPLQKSVLDNQPLNKTEGEEGGSKRHKMSQDIGPIEMARSESPQKNDIAPLTTNSSGLEVSKRPIAAVNFAETVQTNNLEDEIRKLERLFNELVDKAARMERIDLFTLKLCITQLPVSLKYPHLKLLAGKLSDILKAESVLEVFFILAQYWDFLNCGLLDHIIDKFGSQSIKDEMAKYQEKLKDFRSRTTLRDYIGKWTHRVTRYFSEVKMEVTEEWLDRTLEDAEQYRRELSRQSSLDVLGFKKVEPGSVFLTWTLHSSFPIRGLVLLCTKELCSKYGVMKIMFKGICVFDQDGQKTSTLSQEACSEQLPAKQMKRCIEMSSHLLEGVAQLENQPPKMESKPEKSPVTAQINQQEAAKGGQEKQEKEAMKEKEHSQQQAQELEQQLREVMKEKEQFQQKIEELEEQLQQPLKERKHSHPEVEELKLQLKDEQSQLQSTQDSIKEMQEQLIPPEKMDKAIQTHGDQSFLQMLAQQKIEFQATLEQRESQLDWERQQREEVEQQLKRKVDEMQLQINEQQQREKLADTDNPVSQSFRQSVKDMEEKFADLLVDASIELESKNVRNIDVQVYATQLSVSHGEEIAEVMSETTIHQTIMFFSRIGAWDFLNFYLLNRISHKFGSENLQQKVESYSREVAIFKKSTKLCDFLRVWAGRSLPDRKLLIAKLNKKWPDYTLADVADLEGYLASEFFLERFIFNFSNAEPGSVTLMWLIPTSAAKVIKEAIIKGSVNLKHMNIRELCIEEFVPAAQLIKKAMKKKTPDLQGMHTQMLMIGKDYDTLYQKSLENPEQFWSKLAEQYLIWERKFDKAVDYDMEKGVNRWFTGGKINVTKNCLDRHAEDPNKVALIWEKDEPGQHESYTYKELLQMTCQIANVLKARGVTKGDTVIIYMPAIPLAVASMLACARIGAVHSVVFAAFDADALEARIKHAQARVVITANEAVIGGNSPLPLKSNIDLAVKGTDVQTVLVASGTKSEVEMKDGRDFWLKEEMKKYSTECDPVPMDSEDRLFIMYTSGATDEPKGITHTQAGYLLYAAVTHKVVFDYKPGDIFCCVAVLGWITGHTYVVYGPLCNGATTVLFDSTATYPHPQRYWETVQRLKVNQFYTTPSAIRLLMKLNTAKDVEEYDLSSLKTIGSVGEPLNVGAKDWYYEVIGKKRCVLVDTWWQTEVGGIAINLRYAPEGAESKPKVMKPLFGVEPVLVNVNELEKAQKLKPPHDWGYLCLRKPLPGMGREVHGEGHKFWTDYFNNSRVSAAQGLYFTSDVARRDADGNYQIIGRVDDAIRIKGVWLEVPQIECVMNKSDERILESSLVGFKEQDVGEPADCEGTCAFVSLKSGVTSKEDRAAVVKKLREDLQAYADKDLAEQTPDMIEVLLPKCIVLTDKQLATYSGKLVRVVLRRILDLIKKERGPEESTGQKPCSGDYEIEIEPYLDQLGVANRYAVVVF